MVGARAVAGRSLNLAHAAQVRSPPPRAESGNLEGGLTCRSLQRHLRVRCILAAVDDRATGLRIESHIAAAQDDRARGLAVGVLSALKRTGGVWFGWDGELTDQEPGDLEVLVRDGVTFVTIALRREEAQRYYNGFSNDALWPLFHYMPSKFRFRPEEREAYESVNRQFALKLHPLLKPNDVVWVHDYHLIPLARRLREFGTRAPIGFFLHIPFPYIETLRVLPTHAELVRDLVSYDVVGFQTESDLLSFFSAVTHVFGPHCIVNHRAVRIGQRTIRCGVFPIGVDVDAIQAEALAARAGEAVQKMIDGLLGRKLVIGVDRLDYSKGLVERFAAYEQFLEAYPMNCGRITYLQIAPLSR
ncbi:MAG: trehalose-6-phosphate synthase, partial [Lysobacterales bacterium]